MSLKSLLTRLAYRGETDIDTMREALRERLDLDGHVRVRPYFGYGTADSVTIRGRVLRHKPPAAAADDDSFWENALRTYQLLESDEIPHATVRAAGLGDSQIVTADEEGFVEARLKPAGRPDPALLWHDVAFELLDPAEAAPPAGGRVLIPPAAAALGVISDIDDTILHSSATNVVRAVRLMFLENARTRLPFPGVAELYQALTGPQGHNPIFYVSSSPWNLFDLLVDFMEFQGIPHGPLFLKDYGLRADQLFSSGHGSHKLAQIEKIMTTFPNLSFVLIGDSGQKDPEIYLDVLARYPGRVRAIYIRDVTGKRRDAEVEALAAAARTQGSQMLLAADSAVVAEHAAAEGLITAADAAAVQEAIHAP